MHSLFDRFNRRGLGLFTKFSLARTAQLAALATAATAAMLVAGCASRRDKSAPAAPTAATPAPTGYGYGGGAVSSLADYRRRAAQLIMAANPSGIFVGPVPEPLYGIVVVTIAFNADGSIRSTHFLRRSEVGPDANNLAIAAIRRVGNFGAIGNLRGPWEFNETFFYNEDRKFQLRTLVENL